jgi:peptide/nickel transport system permease protein
MNELQINAPPLTEPDPSPGFWRQAWRSFRCRKLGMMALVFVVFLCFVAVFAPMIVGTKPIVCKYKGTIHFPFMGYYARSWENSIFTTGDRFRNEYPKNLTEKDPKSWAIWPLVYQDPYRRVRDDEWPGQPGNVPGSGPNRYNWFGTDRAGVDVLAQMVHGTQIALSVGFVSIGIAALIGIVVGALAGYFGGWIDILLSRLIEIVMCIPTLVLILALVAMMDKVTNYHLMAIVGAISWTGIARLTRAEFLKLKQMEFVSAARAMGAGWFRIIFRHIRRIPVGAPC